MKAFFALLVLTAFAAGKSVEPISADKAELIARRLVLALGTPADAPFASVVDPAKASGLKAGHGGLIFVPETNLTAETVASAGKEPVALGQLWMLKVSITPGDVAPAAAKLRNIEVAAGELKRSVQMYFVTVAKNDTGALELSFFAKEKEALVKVLLAKTDAVANEIPVGLTGRQEGEYTGVLVMTIFGSYKADVSAIVTAE